MSTLSKLMQQLCSNGVEYKKLKDIATVLRGIRVVRNQLTEEGKYPVYQNSLTPLGFYDKENCSAGTPFVISAGAAGDVGFSDTAFWAADDCIYFLCGDQLFARYLYHELLQQQHYIYSQVRRGSVPRLSRHVINNLQIPVPPIEVQREIARILDNFTLLTAELTAELTKRKMQYEYYRDDLLRFEREPIPKVKLGDIGRVAMCKRILKSQTSPVGEIPFFKIGTFGKTADAFISESLYKEYKEKYSYPKKGDILLSAAGTIGRTVIYDGKPAYYQDSNIVWLEHDESKILNKYLFYYYQTNPWKVSNGGTISRLYNLNLENTKIPLPPLEVQERLVKVLDHFDAICSDLKIGLPAEIEARKKQYEYYRDALLTYAETGDIMFDGRTGLIKLIHYVFGHTPKTDNIHRMIRRLCPDGVKYKKLGEITQIKRGDRITKKDIEKEDAYPVISGGQLPMGRYYRYNREPDTITISSYGAAGYVDYQKEKFWANDVCLCVYPIEKILNNKFLYYVLKSKQSYLYTKTTKAIPDHIPTKIIENMKIPVPPIEVQREIVSVLDRFDRLCRDMTEGLPAEIAARKKQYEYYRDKLLAFREKGRESEADM